MPELPQKQSHHDAASDFLTDVTVGLSDGLAVPFVIVTGLSGAFISPAIIGYAGLAATFVGSLAMGFSRYFGGSEDAHDHHHADEEEERHIQQANALKELGLSRESHEVVAKEVAKDEQDWADLLAEHGLDPADTLRMRKSAFNIALAYAVGGLIPSLPYLMTPSLGKGHLISVGLTAICLFLFGFLKGRFTAQKPLLVAFRSLLIGIAAASAAYMVAKIFI